MIENIKFKSNIQKQALSGVLADATCDFTDAGTLAMTEAVLEPKIYKLIWTYASLHF
jgi:hypothetical protein